MLKSQMALASLKQRGPQRHRSNASPGERVLGSMFPGRMGYSNTWSQDRLQQVVHMKNWTFVAIDAIASLIGQLVPNIAYVTHSTEQPDRITEKRLPKNLIEKDVREYEHRKRAELMLARYREVNFQGKVVGLPSYHRKALSVVKPHEELQPVEYDHPLRRLIENPNPHDTSFDLLYELDMFLELCGVAYLWAVPNGWGVPCELWVLPSHWMWPRIGGRHGDYVNPFRPDADKLIEYYECRPWGAMGSAGILKFPPEEIVMVKWKSPVSKIDGWSKLTAAAEWIDTEESMGKSRWAQFMNQALPSLWLELPPDMEDPNDDKIARIEAKVNEKFAGEFNQGKVIITSPGVKATALSFSPESMMYVDSNNQIRDNILSVFRVPGAAVGLNQDMTYGSILSALAAMCSFAVNPRLTMLGLQLQKQLASKFDEDGQRPIKIWWDDCTPPNPEQVNADIQADQAVCAITPNEVRALRGRKPYAHGGDDPMVQGPGGMVPLPLNTGDDWTALGELVPTLGQQQGQEGMPGMGGEEGGANPLAVNEPNGPPQKKLDHVTGKELATFVKWCADQKGIDLGEDWVGYKSGVPRGAIKPPPGQERLWRKMLGGMGTNALRTVAHGTPFFEVEKTKSKAAFAEVDDTLWEKAQRLAKPTSNGVH